MHRRPPHIIVTTPESLYVLLGSESGRKMLATTRSVIVDEIHAIAPNKRGAHLALSLERLSALCGDRLLRIGLSATQNPIQAVASLLAGAAANGARASDVAIIDAGHQRPRDLKLEVPDSPLEAVMSNEVWTQVYRRLAELIEGHRTTLVFVNTRRMAERVARELSERLGEDAVTAHHGSMAKERRLAAEQKLKRGELRAMVATASLELGIDIGEVELVCQLGSPRSIATFLQRAGRSGHAVDGTPKGRLFPLSRDDLVECAALLDGIRRGELDRLTIPEKPLDVLAQQIVAETAAHDWPETKLFDRLRRAWPFRNLTREEFDSVVRMLAEGFATRQGRRGALIHRDAVNGILRGRRGARTTALTSGGTIPDTADYQVLLEPENAVIGTVNEDFAVESMAGDVFQLGNASYRIQRVERGTVRVEDAKGEAPNIPFWLGEAPGRTDALSLAVSRLRHEVEMRLRSDPSGDSLKHWLAEDIGVGAPGAEQLVDYLAAAAGALGLLPTQDCIVFERFFDEAGGMQLVIHAPFGSRINRAWGLALRKRFCRKFNFELQAAATEDNIVLSLTTAHSFELGDVAHYLHSLSVRPVLIQAMLDAPMFASRWRWTAGVSLALPRFRNGKKVPPQIMRMQAEDLIAAVFPDQIACAENLAGDREVPDHPLVNQAVNDSLHEAMDIEGLERLLAAHRIGRGPRRRLRPDRALAAGARGFVGEALCLSRRRPSRGAADAGGDGAPLAGSAERLRPRPPRSRGDPPRPFRSLARPGQRRGAARRAALARMPDGGGGFGDAGLERLARSARPGEARRPPDRAAGELMDSRRAAESLPRDLAGCAARAGDRRPGRTRRKRSWAREQALAEIFRGRLEGLGPVTQTALAAPLGLEPGAASSALAALEADGAIMKGRYEAGVNDEQWCDRRLLARIHRYTINRLRAEIEPVAARDFLRFLFAWQRVDEDARMEGQDALIAVLSMLEGFEAPAKSWETEILSARLKGYQPSWLDAECHAGRIAWSRLTPPPPGERIRSRAPVPATPIALLGRQQIPVWTSLAPAYAAAPPSPRAKSVLDCLAAHGALFFDEIAESAHLLRAEVEDALGELVALGLVTSDSFAGLRALLTPSGQRKPLAGAKRRGRVLPFHIESGGRWALVRRPRPEGGGDRSRDGAVEHVARALLRRYGVVFWRLLAREATWLPPWRDLLRVYRRLESRGEIRGGRFVAGFSGEQFALPEAVGLLREIRRRPASGQWVSLSGADPLNLVGVLTPGARLPALIGNRVVYRDGLPVAVLSGGALQHLARPGRRGFVGGGEAARPVVGVGIARRADVTADFQRCHCAWATKAPLVRGRRETGRASGASYPCFRPNRELYFPDAPNSFPVRPRREYSRNSL